MSLKRAAEDQDEGMSTKHRTKKAATSKGVTNRSQPSVPVHPFFSKPLPQDQQPFQWLATLGEHKTCLHGVHLKPVSSCKVAAFDLDGTTIVPKGGTTHPKDHEDWMFWKPQVVPKFKELHNDGYSIVFFSNQLAPKKNPAARINTWKMKLPLVAAGLGGIPFRVFAATARDGFRKPLLGMWYELQRIFSDDGVEIDRAKSLFVGDAAGRKGDHASTDRKWALNIDIPFFTPEEYFLGRPAEPFRFDKYPFHPSSLATNLPLYTPTSTPLIPTNRQKPEIVLFVGYPATGKTSFFKKHFEPEGYSHVNQDTLKTRAKCLQAAEKLITEGRSCVIDNTNRDRATREIYIHAAKRLGVKVRCLYFHVPVELAHHNNIYRAFCLSPAAQAREEKRSLVPEVAFSSFKGAFETPSEDEGFAEVKTVNWRFEGDEEDRRRWNIWTQ